MHKGHFFRPPLDNLFGQEVEISDDGNTPTRFAALEEGSNLMSATQEGEIDGTNDVRDRNFITIDIPEGFELQRIDLTGFDDGNPTSKDAFLAFQKGTAVTVDPITGANFSAMKGAINYDGDDVGSDLLAAMRGGFNDPQTGTLLPAFDEPLIGELSFWLNQDAGPSRSSLDFFITPTDPLSI